MIGRAKAWAKRHWPRLSLRTYLFASFFLVAALPGVGAVGLRVYENTLVRQTEAELGAQGAALAATASALWPRSPPGRRTAPAGAAPTTDIDLSTTPILPERPAPTAAGDPAQDAVAAARRLAPILAATRAATFASIVLLDREGRIAGGTTARGSDAQLPEVAAALAGVPRTVLRRNADYRAVYRFDWLSRAAAIRIHHARTIVVNGRVVGVLLLSRSARSLFVGLYEDAGKIAIGVLAILAALVVLSGLLSRGIARPIDELREAARRLATGRGPPPPTPVTAAIEIQDLYRDFAAMAEAIERRSRYLRDFAHAVSHEFKTPLAGIRGAMEILEDHADTMTADERRRFLANARGDADRLTLLVSRLLDLARADMTIADPAGEADVVAVARKLADGLATRTMAIVVEADEAPHRAGVAAATIEAVLTTLVDNSAQAGADVVGIAVRAAAGDLIVTVSDDGGGVAPGDRTRIFEPFFTSRRTTGGTGLGLPIARSLLAASGGSLTMLDTAAGAAFEMRLPRA